MRHFSVPWILSLVIQLMALAQIHTLTPGLLFILVWVGGGSPPTPIGSDVSLAFRSGPILFEPCLVAFLGSRHRKDLLRQCQRPFRKLNASEVRDGCKVNAWCRILY